MLLLAFAHIFRIEFGTRLLFQSTIETRPSYIFLCSVPELPLHLVVCPIEDPALRAVAVASVILVFAVAVVCMIGEGVKGDITSNF